MSCFFLQAQYTVKSEHILQPERNIDYVKNCADFWINSQAFDNVNGGFFSNVKVDGTVTDMNSKALVGQTRHAYGFTRAFMLTGDENYLTYANSALDFLYNHGWDNTNGGWYYSTNKTGDLFALNQWWNPNTFKWGFQQHYGLVGIIANYEATRSATAKTWMEKGVDELDSKMWDSRPGYEGYYDEANLNWTNKRGKGFTSTVDAITTHGELIYLVTKKPAHMTRLMQLATNITDKLVPEMKNVTVLYPEVFDANWVPNYTANNSKGSVGHFIKTAWCLGRAYLCDTTKTEYKDAAIKILDQTWTYNKSGATIWDHVNGGPFNTMNISTGATIDKTKDYWTLEQGFTGPMIAHYITKNPNYLQMADESMEFFMTHQVDKVNGEIFMTTSADGQTVINNTKGEAFKASYHSIEMGYYGYLYSSLYYLQQPASLYYKFAATAEAQNISLSPIPIEDQCLRIQSVSLDGVNFPNFDAQTRTLNIAANQGGKFKVTYQYVAKPTGVASVENDNIRVYPNPAIDQLNISGMDDVASISLFDLTGKVILTEMGHAQNVQIINVESLNPGVYFVMLQKTSGAKVMRKIIKL